MRFYNTAMYCKATGMWPSRPQQPDDGGVVHHLLVPNSWIEKETRQKDG